jgi:hypothetical protein
MDEEPESLMDYWNAVDREMLSLYGVDTMAGPHPTAEEIAQGQEDGWTPRQFALWIGETYHLKKKSGEAA